VVNDVPLGKVGAVVLTLHCPNELKEATIKAIKRKEKVEILLIQ
jgi:hypothetical protein